MIRQALRFDDEAAFYKALAVLDRLADEGPLEYDLTSDPISEAGIVVLPQWSYDRLLPLLKEHDVPFVQMNVKHMNELPPERQAKLRGLRRGSTGARANGAL